MIRNRVYIERIDFNSQMYWNNLVRKLLNVHQNSASTEFGELQSPACSKTKVLDIIEPNIITSSLLDPVLHCGSITNLISVAQLPQSRFQLFVLKLQEYNEHNDAHPAPQAHHSGYYYPYYGYYPYYNYHPGYNFSIGGLLVN